MENVLNTQNTDNAASFQNYIQKLNDKQREAVFCTEGPLLIIAGAGSGKTSVLCCRIANIITSGLSKPWGVLAVTFTNKAAGELRERLSLMGVPGASDVWAGTFHSTCVKILRRGIEAIGFNKNFTIYDTDDVLRLVKTCMEEAGISDKIYTPKSIISAISRAKDSLVPPSDFEYIIDGRKDVFLENVFNVYTLYQKRLEAANALDFDDLIAKTVELFTKCPDVLEEWQNRFRYIMIDEYQDTNKAQYKLVSLLAGGDKGGGNLCVVGDEDQSIYRFRGATIENILSFEGEFNAKVIKLEQNYRSTQCILDAANAVIKRNTQRKNKTLFSNIPSGENDKITLNITDTEHEEATQIAKEIEKAKGEGVPFKNNAVLYRTNVLSRVIELVLSRFSIPYRIIGGVRFYERKEIKDIISYLSVIANPYDLVRFNRIINEPKRSVGGVTKSEIERISTKLGISPVDVISRCEQFPSLKSRAKVLVSLGEMFETLSNRAGEMSICEIIDEVVDKSGYKKMLLTEGEIGLTRLENINELKSAALKFEEDLKNGNLDIIANSGLYDPDDTLSGEDISNTPPLFLFLEQVALISDIDSLSEDEDKVSLMTIHSAKGLEFERVFVLGMEEGLFPSYRSSSDPDDIEEERRLAYVAFTRAKQRLVVTTTKTRMLYGSMQHNPISRFVKEIPDEFIEINEKKRKPSAPVKKPEPKPSYLKTQSIRRANAVPIPSSISSVVYESGDRISHKVFGEGEIKSVLPMGNDFLLDVAFDKHKEQKKIMANFAKIEKL